MEYPFYGKCCLKIGEFVCSNPDRYDHVCSFRANLVGLSFHCWLFGLDVRVIKSHGSALIFKFWCDAICGRLWRVFVQRDVFHRGIKWIVVIEFVFLYRWPKKLRIKFMFVRPWFYSAMSVQYCFLGISISLCYAKERNGKLFKFALNHGAFTITFKYWKLSYTIERI